MKKVKVLLLRAVRQASLLYAGLFVIASLACAQSAFKDSNSSSLSATPDGMRGRVNAVDMVFVGASNELGEFESGLTAHWFGAVPAVILGGVGTLIVIGIWAWRFPELRRADQLTSQG